MINLEAMTFIELLIVIIIIGILAASSVPLLKESFDNLTLDNFARDIYYLSRYLQASAVSEGRIYMLDINKDTAVLRAVYKEEERIRSAGGRFGRDFIAPQGVSVSCEPPEKYGIYFYPDASTDKVTVIFSNRRGKNLSLIAKGVSGELKIQ